MKKLLLGLLSLTFGVGAFAYSDAAKDLQDQRWLINRLDDPTLKGYLGTNLRSSTTAVGVFDASDTTNYSGGVPGTYDLIDAVTGKKLVLPAYSVLVDTKVYARTALLTGSTVTVGYSGSAAAILASTPTSTLTVDTVTAGAQIGTAATALVSTADRTVTMTITGATVSSGKAFVLLRMIPGLN